MLEGWRDLNAVAPRQATFTADVHSTASGPIATVGFVWVGDPAQGHRLLPAIRALGRPVAERVTTPSYLKLQQRDDTVGGHTYRRYSSAHYLRQFPTAAIEAFLLRGASDLHAGADLAGVGLQAHGGAIADIAGCRRRIQPPRHHVRIWRRLPLDRTIRGPHPDGSGSQSRSRTRPVRRRRLRQLAHRRRGATRDTPRIPCRQARQAAPR